MNDTFDINIFNCGFEFQNSTYTETCQATQSIQESRSAVEIPLEGN